ncbi:MAG: TPM domain-containing protein [Vulcanibacillus sp.]
MIKYLRTTLFSLSLISVLVISDFPIEVKADSNIVTVEDTYKVFTNEEVQNIEEVANSLPEVYRFVIFPTISEDVEIGAMAESIFETKNFSQDTIFILVITDERKIHITTGEALQKKELNELFFNTEILKYFVPVVKDKKGIPAGLVELIKGISNDIPQFIEKDKSSVELPEALDNSKNIEEDESSTSSLLVWFVLMGMFLLIPWLIFKYRRKK